MTVPNAWEVTDSLICRPAASGRLDSSFTSYSEQEFGDEAQIQLAQYFSQLDQLGAQVLLSNSDPKNTNAQDNFFEELYQGFCIRRVWANRMINSKQEARGPVSELLIANYKIPRPRR